MKDRIVELLATLLADQTGKEVEICLETSSDG